MNAIVWNCPGVRSSRTVRDLTTFVQHHNPKLVILSETRQSEERVKNLRWRIGLTGCLAVSSNGLSGGIALFWEENLDVKLITINNRLIDVSIQETPSSPIWRCTFVYREPRVENRHQMWELLRRIKPRSPHPWLVMGDFNEALWQFEHFSETRRGEKQMEDFREVLAFCDLHDIGFRGLPWTYDNRQMRRRNVRVRLDRAVASSSWVHLFETASVQHLVSPCSDHCPLLLRLGRNERTHGQKVLRYEIMWEREKSLEGEIELAWMNAGQITCLGSISKSLQEVMNTLQGWSKENFGSVRKELEELRKKLSELQLVNNEENNVQIKNTINRMNEILYREEMMWLQRSRISWLKEGDQNTKFFHQKAQWRARKNKIRGLRNDEGECCSDQNKIANMAREFFEALYTKDDNVNPNEIVQFF